MLAGPGSQALPPCLKQGRADTWRQSVIRDVLSGVEDSSGVRAESEQALVSATV